MKLDDSTGGIHAICIDCNRRHTYTGTQQQLAAGMDEWRMKHPAGRCLTSFIPDPRARRVVQKVHAEFGHNADIKLAYATDADYTITLASLATSSTLLTGRESTSVSNTTNLYLDYLIAGEITAGTSPTVDKTIEVIAVGSQDDTPTWPDGITGSDAGFSWSDDVVKNQLARYVASIQTLATTDFDYFFGPVSLAQLFHTVPTHHLIWVGHDSAVNLNSTGGNHVITYQGVYATST